MKAHLILISLALVAVACNTTKKSENKDQKDSIRVETATITAQPEVITATLLSGYFLKNTYTFTGGADSFLFPDSAAFDKVLGIGKTMNNQITVPDFAKQTVGAIALKPTQTKTDLAILKVEKTDSSTVAISYEVKTGEALSYSMTPTLVFQFPKVAGVHTVNFMRDGQIVKTLRIE